MLEIDGRPIFQAHAERKTVSGEHFLDFVQGLAAEVRGLEQFVFRALDQIADVVNIFGLEAVGGTHREFQIVHRTHEDRIQRRRLVFFYALHGFGIRADGTEDRKLILQDVDGFFESVFRRDHAVCFNRHLELIEVGALRNARCRHGVRHTAHGREARIHHDAAQGVLAVVVAESTHVAGLIAAAGFHVNLHVEFAAGEVGDDVVGIQNRDVVRKFNT